MNTPIKLYMVISVQELEDLTKAARKSMKARRKSGDPQKKSHCIVIYTETVPGFVNEGREQVASFSQANIIL